jgi:tetratricopeptide (TPR) repeat protein
VSVAPRKALYERKATLYADMSDFRNSFEEAERLAALCRQTADPAGEGAARAAMAWATMWLHDFPRALSIAAEAGARAEAAGNAQAEGRARLVAALIQVAQGRRAEASENFSRTLAAGRAASDISHVAFALGGQGLMKNHEGDYDDAAALAAEGLEMSRVHGLAIPRLFNAFVVGVTLTAAGHYDRAFAALGEGLALSEKIGDEVWHQRLLNARGWFHIETGDLAQAIDFNGRCLEGARKRGDPETIANAELNLADAFLQQGDLGLADEVLAGVDRLVRDPAVSEWMKWRYSMHMLTSLGELALARDDHDRGREFAARSLEIATRTGSRKYLARALRLQGEISLARRDWAGAETALGEALAVAHAIRNPTQLWKAQAALARLHADRGRPSEAAAAAANAREVLSSMRDSVQDPELRRSLDALLARARVP